MDREKTKAAASTSTTETALAELYAQVILFYSITLSLFRKKICVIVPGPSYARVGAKEEIDFEAK